MGETPGPDGDLISAEHVGKRIVEGRQFTLWRQGGQERPPVAGQPDVRFVAESHREQMTSEDAGPDGFRRVPGVESIRQFPRTRSLW